MSDLNLIFCSNFSLSEWCGCRSQDLISGFGMIGCCLTEKNRIGMELLEAGVEFCAAQAKTGYCPKFEFLHNEMKKMVVSFFDRKLKQDVSGLKSK